MFASFPLTYATYCHTTVTPQRCQTTRTHVQPIMFLLTFVFFFLGGSHGWEKNIALPGHVKFVMSIESVFSIRQKHRGPSREYTM